MNREFHQNEYIRGQDRKEIYDDEGRVKNQDLAYDMAKIEDRVRGSKVQKLLEVLSPVLPLIEKYCESRISEVEKKAEYFADEEADNRKREATALELGLGKDASWAEIVDEGSKQLGLRPGESTVGAFIKTVQEIQRSRYRR